jgi:DUF4097 and DUF4098 domain-containing protein YvlB
MIRNDQQTTLEHVIGPRGRFTLRQASGEINLRGVEGDTVRVRSLEGGKSLDELFHVETGDGFVELRQHHRLELGIHLFSGANSPNIDVEVPHGATVSVETASAEVSASDLSGSKRFRTASGELRLSRFAGPLDAETVSGDVDVDGQAPLELSAKTLSGDVRVRVPRLRRLDMGTTSGDIWLDAELTGDGPFALRSISGDVTIVGRTGFRVEAETITGDLSSELSHKRESIHGRKVLIVGRPGPTIAFRSVSGDLQIVQPRDTARESAPTPPAVPAPPAAPTPTPPIPPAAPGAPVAPASMDVDGTQLEILRALERGDITVAEATDRLGRLDEVLR